jgi:hypothetical protein
MKISKELVTHYLTSLTNTYIARFDLPPDPLDGYHDYVMRIGKDASDAGELDALKLALEHVLGNPDISSLRLASTTYPFEEEEVRDILRYMRKTLWPDAGPISPGGPPGVELVDMPLWEWRKRRREGMPE